MRIYSGISVVNLVVFDLVTAVRFYERLGFRRSRGASDAATALFELNNIVLALHDASARGGAHEAPPARLPVGAPRLSLAQYHPSANAVAAALSAARRAGALLIAKTQARDDGGLQGSFADIDGHVWDVIYDPRYHVAVDGTLNLPP